MRHHKAHCRSPRGAQRPTERPAVFPHCNVSVRGAERAWAAVYRGDFYHMMTAHNIFGRACCTATILFTLYICTGQSVLHGHFAPREPLKLSFFLSPHPSGNSTPSLALAASYTAEAVSAVAIIAGVAFSAYPGSRRHVTLKPFYVCITHIYAISAHPRPRIHEQSPPSDAPCLTPRAVCKPCLHAMLFYAGL